MSSKQIYKWGFVLSGGGARCFAHLGVVKAFKEYGIEPEIYSGTSAGAIAGAFMADGHEPDEILALFNKLKFTNFTDISFRPEGGMSKTTKLSEFIKKNLSAKRFEELKRPLSVTAADFDNGEAVHFSSGELAPPIVASCSIPLVFNPTRIGNTNYVDGGLFQNMPAEPIRAVCERLVGIDVNLGVARPYGKSIRSIAERTLSLVIMSNTRADKDLCDIVLSPLDAENVSMIDVSNSKKIFELGYMAAIELLKNEKPAV